MPSPWRVEGSRVVHADPWVRLEQQRVVTGTGAVLDPFDVVDLPSWVMAVPVLPDGRLVAVEQWRHAIGRVVAELPAGNLEPGEDAVAAALRELAEETGYRPAGPAEPLGELWPEPGRVRGTATAVLVRVDPEPGPLHRDPGEDLAVVLVEPAELLPGGRRAMPHAVQLAFLLMALERLGRR